MQAPKVDTTQQLESWLASPRGRLLVQREQRRLRVVLPHLFGYRLIQVGTWGFEREIFDCGATLCQWVLGGRRSRGADLHFDGESLPITSKCLDAVIMPHSLEQCPSPHRLLREVDRVLCDHGHVVLMGFNPYSPWAIGQQLRRRRSRFPKTGGFYPLGRVRDWLDLLDFEVVSLGRYGLGFPYLPAAGVDAAKAGWWRLPSLFAQAYWLVARKRVVRLTPLPSRFRERAALAGSGMPEPSSRIGQRAYREAA